MIGSRLRERRIRAGVSQVDLAERVGIRPHTLWRYEADQNMPSARVLQRLAEELGTTVESLLAEEGHERPVSS